MRDSSAKDFLGRGIHFPFQIDEATGRVCEASYDQSVMESVKIILMTRKGERLMRPEFGCGIFDFAFEVVDYTVLSMMEREVVEALTLWEPRLTELEVTAKADPMETGRVNLHIRYLVRMTNNPYNMVYPYYMNEGEI